MINKLARNLEYMHKCKQDYMNWEPGRRV